MGYVLRYAALLALLMATGCENGGYRNLPRTELPATPLVTVREGVSVRNAAGQNSITWLEPTGAGKSWQEASGARDRVADSIRATSDRLASVDYNSLSLPDFLTYTRAVTLTATAFTGSWLTVEAFGTDNNGKKWTLYEWQGPEIPQRPDRPLVSRWIKTYALYDMDGGKVTLLLATIRGEVLE